MDSEAEKVVRGLPNGENILKIRDKEAKRIKEEMQEDSETAIMDAKYGIIHGALHEAGFEKGNKSDTSDTHADTTTVADTSSKVTTS